MGNGGKAWPDGRGYLLLNTLYQLQGQAHRAVTRQNGCKFLSAISLYNLQTWIFAQHTQASTRGDSDEPHLFRMGRSWIHGNPFT